MKYTPEVITIYWAVSLSYIIGDYVKLYHNSGVTDDAVDWAASVNDTEYTCFDVGISGYFPFGYQTFGHFNFGHGQSRGTEGYVSSVIDNTGFGHYRFGSWLFGHSPKTIKASFNVQTSGHWKFGLKAFDSKGNSHIGTPMEVGKRVCLTPIEPLPLQYSSYDNGASTITFDINY